MAYIVDSDLSQYAPEVWAFFDFDDEEDSIIDAEFSELTVNQTKEKQRLLSLDEEE